MSKKELGAVSLEWILKNFSFPGDNFIYRGALAGMMIEHCIMFWLNENPVCKIFVDADDYTYSTIGLKNFVHFKSPNQRKNIRKTLQHMMEETMKNKVP